MSSNVNHEPMLTSSRYGCCCYCSCRAFWSGRYTTITGAHLAFGQHLLDVRNSL